MSEISLSKYKKDSIIIDEGIYSVGFYLLSTIILAIVFLLIYSEEYIYTIPLVLLIIMLISTREVIEIDFVNKKYRDGFKFLGKVYREWKPIPAFKYVSVVGSRMNSSGGRIGGFVLSAIAPSSGDTVYDSYEIRLFNTIRQRLTIIQFDNHNKAFEIAKTLAVSLNSKLLDATVMPPMFIIE